ncbi:MAG: sulfite exporter TauE/SafE family protein [Clostridia bacterium]
MIYLIGIFVGILNGLFASGAGQVLVIYLIFFLKMQTHRTRALSVALLSVSSAFALIGYSHFVKFDFLKMVLLIIISAISGFIGAKLMKKIPSNILNLISGVLIVCLTGYKLLKGG